MTTAERLFGTKLNPVNQKELARLTGVDQSTISRWKRDPGAIRWRDMKKLVKARGITGEDLAMMAREK